MFHCAKAKQREMYEVIFNRIACFATNAIDGLVKVILGPAHAFLYLLSSNQAAMMGLKVWVVFR